MKREKKGYKYTHRILKSGKARRIVRGAKGRFLRWEDAEDLDEPKEQYKRVEMVFNFEYNGGQPSGWRRWEFRIQAPYYDGVYEDMREDAENKMRELINDGFVDNCSITEKKAGKEIAGYSSDERVIGHIMDNARPNFAYPKYGRMKDIDDDWVENGEEY